MQKKLNCIAALITILLVLSCKQPKTYQRQDNSKAKLYVYFFHLNDRCPACTAIEECTRKVLDESFKPQQANGTLSFKTFNIDKKENKSIVDNYQISYTSLLLVRADGVKTDFTNISFNYANTNPAKFRELLKAEIEKNLK